MEVGDAVEGERSESGGGGQDQMETERERKWQSVPGRAIM